jgi:hypothetical protein
MYVEARADFLKASQLDSSLQCHVQCEDMRKFAARAADAVLGKVCFSVSLNQFIMSENCIFWFQKTKKALQIAAEFQQKPINPNVLLKDVLESDSSGTAISIPVCVVSRIERDSDTDVPLYVLIFFSSIFCCCCCEPRQFIESLLNFTARGCVWITRLDISLYRFINCPKQVPNNFIPVL